ncbi:hypothetical protein, conserved [Thermococcus onnurineus NA1]|uniref:Uncharacterized protein n=1 Tax=Thermococcus onnurineus (strain NA1) TaxID=523850 RepID=B6YWZ7_THEON|nr:hypothetical protein [Thermococcus onnurineus]ACJ16610.1 hypothetical protein, conserved [Thermococcus onnurineus NA1]
MRFVTKNEAVKRSLLEDLKREGIKFELHERLSYESFVGYLLEGTLEEIGAQIDVMEGADKEALKEGFLSFKESLNHILEHIKVGEKFETLIQEGPWVVEILDQLTRNEAIEYSDGIIKLKEGVDITKLRFEFKFPFNLVHNPESTEKIAKQFAFTDLTMEYEFEILELDIRKINTLGKLAARYFPEDYLLKVYFGLIGRAILAGEILKTLGNEKVPEEDLVKGFVRVSPMAIPTEKGTLVINYSPKALEEILRLLKKLGYLEIKAGKVKKLRDLV